MFRKRDGSIGFSFSNFVNAAVPTMAAFSTRMDWCPELGQDMLYAHQLAASHPGAPYGLDEHSLFVGGICEHEGTSTKVFHKLGRAGILDENGIVRTYKIEGKKFPHQVSLLSQPRQRDLVNLLFWWEEECQRLRKLTEEEKELGSQIKKIERAHYDPDAGWSEDDAFVEVLRDDHERRQLLDNLKFEREKLRMRIRQRPSQRRADIEAGTDQLLSQVHATSANSPRRHTEPVLHGSVPERHAEPPAYRP
ncbi:hypothetical protein LTS08_008022 [Lithohypha guttulata]|nr:hypothetical protein LTS08_008022 [Lithohypha guttulata]